MIIRQIVILFLLVAAQLFIWSHVGDSSKQVIDQNPNYQKSKNKYTKPKTEAPSVVRTPTFTTSPKTIDSSHVVKPNLNVSDQVNNSLESYQKTLMLAEKKHDYFTMAAALSDIGAYYVKNNNLQLALDNYQKSLKISESQKNKLAILDIASAIGDIYSKQKNYAKSEEYYLRSLKIAEATGNTEKVKLASNALSKLYVIKGNYKNAFEMQLLFKKVTDSLYKKEAQDALIQNQIKNEYNKRHILDSIQQIESSMFYEKGILQKQSEVDSTRKITYLIAIGLILALLLAVTFYRSFKNTKKTNKIIALQKEETEEKKLIIEKSLEEKEILLKEIHHRVKNNLQIISSLLSLQANRTEDAGLKKIMSEAKNRISSMALIHQKIYQSDNLSSINFQTYVEQMTESIDSTFNTQQKEITYFINTNDIALTIDHAIPLGLIINELLTNIHKYAFEDRTNGTVTIVLEEKNNNEIELHISDDGIGIPKELNVNALRSLGLKLVKGLADQLKGNFRFENNHGAHFFVNFKKVELKK